MVTSISYPENAVASSTQRDLYFFEPLIFFSIREGAWFFAHFSMFTARITKPTYISRVDAQRSELPLER